MTFQDKADVLRAQPEDGWVGGVFGFNGSRDGEAASWGRSAAGWAGPSRLVALPAARCRVGPPGAGVR